MKLIESKVEYLPQENGIEGIYKNIEIAGRVAYQSLDKITDDSAKGFVDRMINSKHYAALEHGTVYLFYSVSCYDRDRQKWVSKYESNPYSKVICVGVDDNEPAEDGNYYDLMGNKACGNEQYVITTNYRVLVENNWLDDIQYLCSPTEYHEKRYTFRFTCSRAIAQELTRHQARDVLPNATKTELIMTGFSSDWRYLLDLRLFNKTGKSHPDMLNLMEKLRYEALEAGIWYDIMKYPSKFE